MDSSKLDAAAIDEIEPFTQELTGIVKVMQVQLATETCILDGTEVPTREDIVIPPPEDPEAVLRAMTGQNELSGGETKECQWNNVSETGYWTIDLTQNSTLESSNSASIAELFNQNCPIPQSVGPWSLVSMNSCEGKSDACGCVTGATNEPCACMEQTINVPMAGTPNEEK